MPPTVLVDASVATMNPEPGATDALGFITDAAIIVTDGLVDWVGKRADIPPVWAGCDEVSLTGRLVTPGLVECHTHLIFGGDRRNEFAARSAGQRYDGEVAASGIRATAAATTAASDDELLDTARRRARWFIRHGVTTLEMKTGYGLTPEAELRLLRIAGQLRDELPITTRVTLLAGHVYPEDADPEDYVIQICDELLPAAVEQGIFDSVEVYCDEDAGISMEDASTILETIYRKKRPTRVTADHLTDSAGGALAPAFYSKAAAHLTYTDDIAVKAMGRAGTTAVLLPGAALEVGNFTDRPPVDLLRENHVPLAVSTGCNPGTSPMCGPRTAAHLACTLFGLTPDEALAGITRSAGRALAIDGAGTLVAGGRADLAVWDAEHPTELIYWYDAPSCEEVWSGGQRVDRQQ